MPHAVWSGAISFGLFTSLNSGRRGPRSPLIGVYCRLRRLYFALATRRRTALPTDTQNLISVAVPRRALFMMQP